MIRRFCLIIATLATGFLPGSLTAPAPPEPLTLKGHTGWVGGVAFSPDGTILATASADKTVKLWDVKTGKDMLTLKGHEDAVACVAFSHDGKMLATGSYDHTAKLWDAKTGEVKETFEGHKGAVMSVLVIRVGFGAKSDVVITGSIDGSITKWELKSNPETLYRHKSWVNAVAYTPDGGSLASASSDGTIIVSGLRRMTLRPKAAELRSIAFSPDGKLLAAGTRYGLVKVWNEKGNEVASLKGKHGGDVWAVAFSPDSKTLASAEGDWNKPGEIRLWDTATWKERGSLKHTNEVLCLAFAKDKPVLAAGAWDKTVKVWDLTEMLKGEK